MVFQLSALASKPRQHLCYVYASLSRLGFRGLPEKLFIVFEGVIGFSTAKKPTALMMRGWNGGRGGGCTGHAGDCDSGHRAARPVCRRTSRPPSTTPTRTAISST